MGLDYLFALRRRDRPDLRLVAVVRIVVDENVLQFLLREELAHGLRQHRLAGPGGADHHHVAALFGCLQNDVAGVVLPDDLIDEAVRNSDLLARVGLETAEQAVLVVFVYLYLGVDLDVATEVGAVQQLLVVAQLVVRARLVRSVRRSRPGVVRAGPRLLGRVTTAAVAGVV